MPVQLFQEEGFQEDQPRQLLFQNFNLRRTVVMR
jgi:hypothetical protein